MDKEEFFEAYEAVFDENGDVRKCGRDACIKLIELCEQKNHMLYFGDLETGFMEKENIKTLYMMEKGQS